MYIFSEFLVSEWSFGVNYPIICWLLTQHSRLIIWEKPQNFIEFYVKKSSQLLLPLFFITPAHSYFMNQKNGRNIFVPFFLKFLVQLDLSWSTFKYLNWQYYSCRNRDTFDSLELIKCLSLVLWPKPAGSMSYVNRKLKDIKASIMYFDYGVLNAIFANCWKTCKKFASNDDLI